MNLREPLPSRHRCETFKVKMGSGSWFVNLGFYEDGRIGELNLNTSKAGSDYREAMGLTGMFASLALQAGVPVEELIELMQETNDYNVFKKIAEIMRDPDGFKCEVQ